jgi:hypothetical protein
VAGTFEHGNEITGSLSGAEFPDQQRITSKTAFTEESTQERLFRACILRKEIAGSE